MHFFYKIHSFTDSICTIILVPKEVCDWHTEGFMHWIIQIDILCTTNSITLQYKVMYMHLQVLKPQNAFFPCRQEMS